MITLLIIYSLLRAQLGGSTPTRTLADIKSDKKSQYPNFFL
jgi:hypothetical protein